MKYIAMVFNSKLATVATYAAMLGVGTDSLWSLYEPEIPESLKK